MRKNWLLVILVAFIVIAAGFGLAQKAPKGKAGTTLAAYKTIDICDLGNGYWRYSGEIAVWNEGDVDTVGFTINDWIEVKPINGTGPEWYKIGDVFVNYMPGEIPKGTTQLTAIVFPYSIDLPAYEGYYIRNNVQLTILNHSGSLGTPKGPNPKATYMGPIPPPPCEIDKGCTYTQGYWKNHPEAWPAGYSPGDTFFLSEMTWQEVLDTPAGGNGYYILAHQYIAAVLNKANGAYVPEGVQTTLDQAKAWFGTALPDDCSNSGSCGLQKAWAKVLDDYNNGIYLGGPPHCNGNN